MSMSFLSSSTSKSLSMQIRRICDRFNLKSQGSTRYNILLECILSNTWSRWCQSEWLAPPNNHPPNNQFFIPKTDFDKLRRCHTFQKFLLISVSQTHLQIKAATHQSVCWSSMTSRILGLRTAGLVGWAPPGVMSVAADAADLACAAAATFWAIWALFTTLEKELRKLPGLEMEPELGPEPEPEPKPVTALWVWLGRLKGCRLSVAGEAGEEVDDPGGVGRCRSIM